MRAAWGARAAVAAAAALAAVCGHAAAGTGAVKELTEADFDAVTAEGVWVVKFYAPWCGHCKHLAPVFEAAAERVGDQIGFAKVDATVESGLKSRYDVTGYPTLKYFKDGEVHDYNGRRTEDAFALFAARITGPAVHRISNAKKLRDLMAHESGKVSFVYHRGAEDDDEEERRLYAHVAESLKTEHVFCETSLKELVSKHEHPTPFLAKLEKGEKAVILDVNEGLNEDLLRTWISENQFPVISADDQFGALARSGRLVVAAIVDPSSRKTRGFLKAIRDLARPSTPLAADVASRYFYMELDGVNWAEFVEQFNVRPNALPRVVVFDRPNNSFYEDPEVDEVDEIETFLTDVADGRVAAQREGWWGAPQRWWRKALEWSPYSFVGMGAFLSMIVWACCFGAGEDDDEDDEDPASAARSKKLRTD